MLILAPGSSLKVAALFHSELPLLGAHRVENMVYNTSRLKVVPVSCHVSPLGHVLPSKISFPRPLSHSKLSRARQSWSKLAVSPSKFASFWMVLLGLKRKHAAEPPQEMVPFVHLRQTELRCSRIHHDASHLTFIPSD